MQQDYLLEFEQEMKRYQWTNEERLMFIFILPAVIVAIGLNFIYRTVLKILGHTNKL